MSYNFLGQMRWYITIALVLSMLSLFSFRWNNLDLGKRIDSLHGVAVYYNGDNFTNVSGRNIAPDGYNLGLKYQCVEFVKRFYYEHLDHKMPNTYGHAKDFFDQSLGDKGFNQKRGLMQYRNVREYAPKVHDILVYNGYPGNRFGHVAIISQVGSDYVEIVQQNMGKKTRVKIPLVKYMQYNTVADYNILGWLRKES